MKFGTGRRNRRELVEINVTSMIDVIFNLLLFFVLSTSFTQASGLVVDLPQSAAADVTSSPKDIVVALTREGQTVVLGQAVDRATLEAALGDLAKQNKGAMVIVQADEEVAHGRVVEVIDAAKKKGLAHVVIATRGE